MEDFFSEITDQMIQARLIKMKEFLRQEHSEMLKKMEEQSDYLFGNRKSNKNNLHNNDEVQQSYNLFQTACENILETYFTLLCEDDFLALQSEQEIMDKMASIKSVIQRNSSSLIKKLNKPKEEVQKEKKIKKDSKRKGKNSKIALESTSIMQQWLLQNFHDPYPTQSKKQEMARQSKLSVYQVNNWFINARQRVIKRFLKKDIKQSYKNFNKSQQSEEQS